MTYEERYHLLCEAIEEELRKGRKDFTIMPFVTNGMMVKSILNERYLIREKMIVDNKLCEFRSDVRSASTFRKEDIAGHTVLLTIENPEYYDEVADAMRPLLANDSDMVKNISADSRSD